MCLIYSSCGAACLKRPACRSKTLSATGTGKAANKTTNDHADSYRSTYGRTNPARPFPGRAAGLRDHDHDPRRLCGLYMLAMGLLIEACEGGIRKDYVTLSYLFVTGGLAFIALLFFTITCDHYHVRWLSEPLELVGRNPMVAYVSNGLAVIPLLQLCHVFPIITGFCTTPLLGFLQGIVLTALCMLLTAFFTKRQMYWKT
ncbi:hypothetical protein [Prevotella sp.]|uniref:hypothetical protein n=1 Tax=Prevotella sp. TaxID=59823 RepID=UPI003F7FE0F0